MKNKNENNENGECSILEHLENIRCLSGAINDGISYSDFLINEIKSIHSSYLEMHDFLKK